MKPSQTFRAQVLAIATCTLVAVAGYAGDSDQLRKTAGKVTEAADAVSPDETVQLQPRAVLGQGWSAADVLIYRYDFDELVSRPT